MGRFKVTVTSLDDAKDQPMAPLQTTCAVGPELGRRSSSPAPTAPGKTAKAGQTRRA